MNPKLYVRVSVRFFITLLVLTIASWANAYMYAPVGIRLPVVHDGRVYCVQADRRITVIDLADGHVIHRPKSPQDNYRLATSQYGLLLFSADAVRLLDWETLTPLWSTDSCWSHEFLGSDVLVLTGGERTWAVDAMSGRELWSVPGYANHLIIVGDRGMLVQETHDFAYGSGYGGGYGEPHSEPRPPDEYNFKVLLIDIPSGNTLATIAWEETGWRSREYAFDGEHMYLVESGDRYSDTPDPPQAWHIERSGHLTPIAEVTQTSNAEHWIEIQGQRYGRSGKPYADNAEPAHSWNYQNDEKTYTGNGFTAFDESLKRPDAEAMRLRFVDDDTTWRIVVPHVRPNRDHIELTPTDDVVLISTSRGQLECLDRKTGQSLWLYVSPWTRETLSVSGNSAPFISELVTEFDREQASQSKRSQAGVVPTAVDWTQLTDKELLAAAAYPAVAVIEDPQPFEPLAEFRGRLRVVRALPAVIAGVGLGVFWLGKKYLQHPRRVWVLGAAVVYSLIGVVILFHGKVSLYALTALALEAWLMIAAVVWLAWLAIRQWKYQVSTAAAVVLMVVVTKLNWYAVSWSLGSVPDLFVYGYQLWEWRG